MNPVKPYVYGNILFVHTTEKKYLISLIFTFFASFLFHFILVPYFSFKFIIFLLLLALFLFYVIEKYFERLFRSFAHSWHKWNTFSYRSMITENDEKINNILPYGCSAFIIDCYSMRRKRRWRKKRGRIKGSKVV